jgi:membrane protein DedA with SNARE-associated domain
MLVAAAVYAGTGHLNIVFVIIAAAVGAILGDNIGYAVGRTGGRALVERYGKYIRVDTSKLATAERFFAKHGDKTVFWALRGRPACLGRLSGRAKPDALD